MSAPRLQPSDVELIDDVKRIQEAAGRCLCAYEELAARWHDSLRHVDDTDKFHIGRRVEIEHTLAVLSGLPLAEVRRRLRAGEL